MSRQIWFGGDTLITAVVRSTVWSLNFAKNSTTRWKCRSWTWNNPAETFGVGKGGQLMQNPHMGLHTDTRTHTDQTAQAHGPFITDPHMGLWTQTRTDAEWPSQAPGPIIKGDFRPLNQGCILKVYLFPNTGSFAVWVPYFIYLRTDAFWRKVCTYTQILRGPSRVYPYGGWSNGIPKHPQIFINLINILYFLTDFSKKADFSFQELIKNKNKIKGNTTWLYECSSSRPTRTPIEASWKIAHRALWTGGLIFKF